MGTTERGAGGDAGGGLAHRHMLTASTEDARYERLAQLALLLPERDARENEALILDRSPEGTFTVGMIDPGNFLAEKNVARALGVDTSDIDAREVSRADFEQLFLTAYRSEYSAVARVGEAEPHRTVSWADINPESEATEPAAVAYEEPAQVSASGFTVHVEFVLREGARRGASDVHFKPGPRFGGIYFEINNELYTFSENVPREEMEKIVRTLADMAGLNEYELPYGNKDAGVQMVLPVKGKAESVKTTMRLAAAPALDGIDVTVRYLNQEFRDFGEMGHEPEQTELFLDAGRHHNGLIIVTGTTGSGKSTLLEAILRRATADGKKNTINIGEPIEYEDAWRTQIPITKDYQWAMALETALRKNPKIIVVGEVRNEEVARIAFRAAYTGHLILTTLHTNDVASTFGRLSNLGIPAYDQGELIRSITSQALVKVLCEKCKTPDPRAQLIAANIVDKVFPDRADMREAVRAATLTESPFYMVGRGKGVGLDKVGCVECNFTGYTTRTAVAEVLNMAPDLSSMIGLGMRGDQTVEFAVNRYGMMPLAEAAAKKLLRGQTSYAEVEQWLKPPPRRREEKSRSTSRPYAQPHGAPSHHAEEGDDRVIEAEYTDVEEAA